MEIMYNPVCEPLVSSCIDCRWLACRLVTLDSYRNRKCRWWDVWAEPTVLPLFEGLPDVNTTYFMFMVVVLTDVLRWARLIPLADVALLGWCIWRPTPLSELVHDMEWNVEMLMTIVTQWLLDAHRRAGWFRNPSPLVYSPYPVLNVLWIDWKHIGL